MDRSVLVAVATLLYWTGSQALRLLIPLRLDELGSSEILVGAIMALFPLSGLLLAIPGGRYADRVGLRRVVVVGFVSMTVLGLAFGLAPSPPAIGALMAVAGIAEMAVWISLQAIASNLGTGARLSRRLAVFSIAWGIGAATGPLLGTVLYQSFGFASLGLTYLAFAAAGLACVWFAPRARAVAGLLQPPSVRSGLSGMWGSPAVRLTLMSSFVSHFVLGIRNSFLPLYLTRAGLDVPRVGWVLAAAGIASLAIRIPLPWVISRWGPERVLRASMWVALAAVALVPLADGFSWWLLVGLAFGVGLGSNPPLTIELMAHHTEPVHRGLAMGLRVAANRTAQVVQPVAFGAIVATAGFGAAFVASGAILTALTGLTGRARRRF